MSSILASDILAQESPRARLGLLLQQFRRLPDERDPERIMYPLHEVLLLCVCATICSCDDFEDIEAWGNAHADVLRQFSEFHFGVPCARWLRALFNRIDPQLFTACFEAWIKQLWPDRHDLIAIDGKTARRSHGRSRGIKAMHVLSAYATDARLTLAQTTVSEKSNEITAIPELIDHLAQTKQLQGAIVTIDAMGCQADIAARITGHKAHFLLALKGNHPNLEAEIASYFNDAPPDELICETTLDKAHGRIETRIHALSANTGWIASQRSGDGGTRFTGINSILKIVSRIEYPDRCSTETRYYISSLEPDIKRAIHAARGHWGVESMHWLLDVVFNEDQNRYRAGHGAQNMAFIRRFAINLLRAEPSGKSLKIKRKRAGWDPNFLLKILQIK